MRKTKKMVSLLLGLTLLVTSITGCAQETPTAAIEESEAASEVPAPQEPEAEKQKDSQSHYTDPKYEPEFTVRDEEGNKIIDNRGASGENGVVSTASVYASRAGVEILEAGGNAVDAAVATSFALGVVLPSMCGIGGGGFMMIRTAEGEEIFLDGQVFAPMLATPDIWQVDGEGNVVGDQKRFGGKAVCVPTMVATLTTALEEYGTMTLEEVMEPAIRLAEEGFAVEPALISDTQMVVDALTKYEEGAKLYLPNNGLPLEEGAHFENPELAKTLRIIAEKGKEGFYTGEVADSIVNTVQKYGGVMVHDDLLKAMNEQPIKRTPVRGDYRGYEVISCAPASSGGSMVIEILNILENFDMANMEIGSAEYINLLMEASKLAFADRAAYMGDPAFVDLPVDGLITDEYGAERAREIVFGQSKEYNEGEPWKYVPKDSIWVHQAGESGYESEYESPETTHFSIADKDGNMVSMTQTLQYYFGSCVFPEGCGFVLNDQCNDFAIGAGKPNSVEGGKKPLSSMSPTIVLDKEKKPYLVLGTPGGITIFQRTAHIISEIIDHNLSIDEAIQTPKYSWNPNLKEVWLRFNSLGDVDALASDDVVQKLEDMGYVVADGIESRFAIIQYSEDGTLYGTGDPRADCKALGY